MIFVFFRVCGARELLHLAADVRWWVVVPLLQISSDRDFHRAQTSLRALVLVSHKQTQQPSFDHWFYDFHFIHTTHSYILSFYRHTALFLTNITMSMCYSDNQSNDRFEDILCLDLWATHTYGTYLIIFNSTADTPGLQFWPSLNYVIEKHKTLIHICSISISMHLPTNLLAPTNCKHRDFANVTFYLTLCFTGHQWSQTNLNVSIIGKGSKGSNPYLTSPYAQHCHVTSVTSVGVTRCDQVPPPTAHWREGGVCVCTLPAATHWHGLAQWPILAAACTPQLSYGARWLIG